MTWKNIKRKQLKNESIFLLLIICCFVAGAIAEYIAFTGKAKLFVLNYNSVSLGIIQIQATVQTLSIALLAIGSSQMDKSFLGITYNDYHFNLKPVIFKQKRIIHFTIILLLVNIYFHMAECYDLVVSVFIIVCILIMISVLQIYSIFADNTITVEEIELFLHDLADSEDSRRKAFFIRRITKDWINILEEQSLAVYENYLDVFLRLCMGIVGDEDPASRQLIQNECSAIVGAYNRAASDAIRIRALSVISKLYQNMRSAIDNSETGDFKKLEGHACVLYESFKDLSNIIQVASVSDLEDCLQWNYLINDVLYVNYAFDYRAEEAYDLFVLDEFASQMARKLAENRDNKYFSYIWQLLITEDTLRICLPEETQMKANASYQKIRIKYVLTLLGNNMLDFLKEHFYRKMFRGMYQPFSEDQAILFLAAHCYVIYISEYENQRYVPEERRHLFRELLDNPSIRSGALSFLMRIGENEYSKTKSERFLSSNMIDKIKNILKPYEIMHAVEAKFIIMDTVVQDVIVVVSALISSYLEDLNILENIITDDNAVSFYLTYIQNTTISERVSRILEIFGAKPQKSEEIMTILRNKICKAVKNAEIKKAHQDHEKFISSVDRDKLKKDLEDTLLEHLSDTFSDYSCEENTYNESIHLNILSLSTFSDQSIEDNIRECYGIIDNNLLVQLASYLINARALELRHRSEFSDDHQYLEFLKASDCHELLGSDFIFRAIHYKNYGMIQKFFQNTDFHSIESSRIGIMTSKNALRFGVQKVTFEIEEAGLSNQNYILEDGKYIFDVSSNIKIEFSQDELKEYLRERRLVINVGVDISLIQPDRYIGYVLEE